jgi:hypothetical protein
MEDKKVSLIKREVVISLSHAPHQIRCCIKIIASKQYQIMTKNNIMLYVFSSHFSMIIVFFCA